MNIRVIFIIVIAAISVGGFAVYKKFSSVHTSEKIICIFSPDSPGAKDDVQAIRQALQLYDIKQGQIIENSNSEATCIKIFLDQQKFDEHIKKDELSLKIAVRLRECSEEEEDPKIIGVFEEDDQTEPLFELIETIVKQPINCLLVYDESNEYSKRIVSQYQELARIKEINLRLCTFSSNRNASSLLKEVDKNINVVIVLPGAIIFQDIDRILEHFKAHKIPVFTNHAGLIRCGALGGYDFDTTEIAHSIAEACNSFLKDKKNIQSDDLDELYPQLHLNMDTIRHLGLQLDPDLLDEAVTVGGADL